MVHQQDKIQTFSNKESKIYQGSTKEENDTKESLRRENDSWNDLKSQIHWNSLEWVDPKSRNMKITPFAES